MCLHSICKCSLAKKSFEKPFTVSGGCCLIAQSLQTDSSCMELDAHRRFIYLLNKYFKIVQGSDLNAGIQSDIADQYGLLKRTFCNQAGRWRMAFGGSGGCGAGAFNGFWGCSSERNGMFYPPLLRKDSNSQREDILLLKRSLGNCCTGHPCPLDLWGNSL